MLCENANEAACIYGWVMISILWLLLLPLQCYCAFLFYQYRHHPGLVTRYPSVCLFSAAACMLHSYTAETFYYLQSGAAHHYLMQHSLISWIASIFFAPLFLLMAVSFVFRLWTIHFNINYFVYQSKHDWQALLCENIDEKERNWYSRHIHDFGNWRFAKRYFILYWIIGAVLEIAVTVSEHPAVLDTPDSLSGLVYLVVNFPLVVCAVLVAWKTPIFHDIFFVRKEMRLLGYVSFLGFLGYGATVPFAEVGSMSDQLNSTAISIVTVGISLSTTCIVLRQLFKSDTNMRRYKNGRGLYRSVASSTVQYSPHSPHSPTEDDTEHQMIEIMRAATSDHTQRDVGRQHSQRHFKISKVKLLNIVVANDVAIDFFLGHLRSEFALENALVFIELVQFIYKVTKRNFTHYDLSPLEILEFEFSSTVPTSSANDVYDEQQDNWFTVIELIYQKYVISSSEYQVNLPYSISMRFAELLKLYRIKTQIEDGSYQYQYGSNKHKHALTLISSIPEETHEIAEDENDESNANKPNQILDALQNLTVSQDSHKYGLTETNSVTNTPIADDHPAVMAEKTGLEIEIPENTKPETDEKSMKDACAGDNGRKSGNANDEVVVHQKKRSSLLGLGNLSGVFTRNSRRHSQSINLEKTQNDALRQAELKTIEKAGKIGKQDFISIACQIISIVIQYNYQSIERFKMTEQFEHFMRSVNIQQLVHEFGDKGVSKQH